MEDLDILWQQFAHLVQDMEEEEKKHKQEREERRTHKVSSRHENSIRALPVSQEVQLENKALDKDLRFIGRNRIITYVLCINLFVKEKLPSHINSSSRKVIKDMLINGIAMVYIKKATIRWQHYVNQKAQLKKQENRERNIEARFNMIKENKSTEKINSKYHNAKSTKSYKQSPKREGTENTKNKSNKRMKKEQHVNNVNNEESISWKNINFVKGPLKEMNVKCYRIMKKNNECCNREDLQYIACTVYKNVQLIKQTLDEVVLPLNEYMSRTKIASSSFGSSTSKDSSLTAQSVNKMQDFEETTETSEDPFTYIANNSSKSSRPNNINAAINNKY